MKDLFCNGTRIFRIQIYLTVFQCRKAYQCATEIIFSLDLQAVLFKILSEYFGQKISFIKMLGTDFYRL